MKTLCYQILFILLVTGAISAQESRLAPEAEPLALVQGCVNAVTGEFVQQETDLVLSGPAPLFLGRIYDSGLQAVESQLGCGFTWAIPRKLTFDYTVNQSWTDKNGYRIKRGTTFASLEQREGVSLVYQGARNDQRDGQEYHLFYSSLNYGYTNYSPNGVSGATSLHNVNLLHRDHGHGYGQGTWTVTLGCGTQRIYTRAGCKMPHCWTLAKEIRPDGNRVLYEYDDKVLRKVSVTDAAETTTMAAYTLTYENRAVYATGTNGQTVQYLTDKVRDRYENQWRLVKVHGEHLPDTEYVYVERGRAHTAVT